MLALALVLLPERLHVLVPGLGLAPVPVGPWQGFAVASEPGFEVVGRVAGGDSAVEKGLAFVAEVLARTVAAAVGVVAAAAVVVAAVVAAELAVVLVGELVMPGPGGFLSLKAV